MSGRGVAVMRMCSFVFVSLLDIVVLCQPEVVGITLGPAENEQGHGSDMEKK